MWYRCNISGKPHQIKSGLTDKFFRWKLSNRISAFWWTAWQLAPIGLAVHSRYSLDDLMYDSKRIAGQVFRLSICFSVSSKMLFSLLVYSKIECCIRAHIDRFLYNSLLRIKFTVCPTNYRIIRISATLQRGKSKTSRTLLRLNLELTFPDFCLFDNESFYIAR